MKALLLIPAIFLTLPNLALANYAPPACVDQVVAKLDCDSVVGPKQSLYFNLVKQVQNPDVKPTDNLCTTSYALVAQADLLVLDSNVAPAEVRALNMFKGSSLSVVNYDPIKQSTYVVGIIPNSGLKSTYNATLATEISLNKQTEVNLSGTTDASLSRIELDYEVTSYTVGKEYQPLQPILTSPDKLVLSCDKDDDDN